METKTNYFNELNKINVNEKTEKKGKFSYLSWSYAWAEIKKIDEKASYVVAENVNGLPFFYEASLPNLGAFVKVSVTVNGITHTLNHPILNSFNKAVKVDGLDSFIVNTSIMRALAKCIALHGLGLYIFNGEDLPEIELVEIVAKEKQEIKAEVAKQDDDPLMRQVANIKGEVKLFIANGDTYSKKDDLKKAGFNWNTDRKGWTIKAVSADDIKKIDGVTYKAI